VYSIADDGGETRGLLVIRFNRENDGHPRFAT
jgi:hypothetical protein